MISNESRILITGGTGSFGKKFISKLLEKFPDINRLVIFSRDELKQWELKQIYPKDKYPQLRFFIGDIRDKERLKKAVKDVDIVVHAAALKQVPAAEYDPMEYIKTNVLGAENLVNACLESDVKKVIALSTDKAAAPINLYGATKLCSDKLFIAANNVKGAKDIYFSIVRYGNVMGSRGSVIPYFIDKANTRSLPITDERMTRFNISLDEGVQMVFWAIDNMLGGEIFVPKIPSYRILDLANAIGPNCEKKIIGLRPGEKIHEEMITSSDSYSTIDIDNYYVILPSYGEYKKNYIKAGIKFEEVEKEFSYNSGSNKRFLTKEEIIKLIRKNIDSSFNPV